MFKGKRGVGVGVGTGVGVGEAVGPEHMYPADPKLVKKGDMGSEALM